MEASEAVSKKVAHVFVKVRHIERSLAAAYCTRCRRWSVDCELKAKNCYNDPNVTPVQVSTYTLCHGWHNGAADEQWFIQPRTIGGEMKTAGGMSGDRYAVGHIFARYTWGTRQILGEILPRDV